MIFKTGRRDALGMGGGCSGPVLRGSQCVVTEDGEGKADC